MVFGSLWLLSAAQRHLDRRFRWAGPRVSRSAYGAFMVQVVPLIGLAFALRPVPLPAEVKLVFDASPWVENVITFRSVSRRGCAASGAGPVPPGGAPRA